MSDLHDTKEKHGGAVTHELSADGSHSDTAPHDGPIVGEHEAALERKLVFKLDILILPLTALLYLSAFLDRSNMGNAKLQGLFKILGDNPDTKFSIILSAFYITYIVLNVPGTVLSTLVEPSVSIALGTLIWSVACTAQAGAHNFGALVATRLFIGIGEAMFTCSVAMYYGMWYKRTEIAARVSLFIGSGTLAGAFGGLIAYGVSFIKSSKLETWRLLFLIEGLPGILLALCIFLFLPSRPAKSRYINETERELAIRRLQTSRVASGHLFEWSAVRHAFSQHTAYLNGVVCIGLNCSVASVAGFLPTIVKTFGYSAARAQLFTVPPYAFAFVGSLLICFLSDRTKHRGLYVAFTQVCGIAGFAILIGVTKNMGARYFGTFLVVLGGFGGIPLMLAWAGDTAGSQTVAAVRMGLMNGIGQCFAILASFIFPTKEGPQWYKGFGINLGFCVLSMVTALYLSWYYRRENARRDKAGDVATPVSALNSPSAEKGLAAAPQAQLHDYAPGFRYTP
ncbi:hypothetical protein Q8F55_007621 [Vanrija albida]|uniref:Major facilitator superfamily (MFS) profile domain-containing protein n=1 Tax=Vanrija albida TaxID=181172 RepID=A0ABR3PU14_9TREE